MRDGSSSTTDFDEAFGQTGDVARLIGASGHPDEATMNLATPEPLGYWPDAEVNAALAQIEDDRTVTAADKIVRRDGKVIVQGLLARFPAGSTFRLGRDVSLVSIEDLPGIVEEPATRYTISIFAAQRVDTLAFGSGETWEEAAEDAIAYAARQAQKGGQNSKATTAA